ncbi:hypothetical protein OJF2_62060 [Aquisphaera giovannonii]|uniref:Uncharacterized protein n=1 Tax=Aquisphaera giovannonii TaxID=406548 RepID=A0A5B9WC46_9BACT|nr:hypothetical protein [Aquisphaera giovannonii]QEH37615.1 hypothetical protein OJF2_62060 [Aquisphaera giovannonii]
MPTEDATIANLDTPADPIAQLEAEVADLKAVVEAGQVFFARVAKVVSDLATIKATIHGLFPAVTVK